MTIRLSVNEIIDAIIKAEGEYTNHPSDRGGPTRWGITEAVARAYGYTGDMRQLPVEFARQIYYDGYYRKPGFESVAQLSPAIAAELTDTGVNMGPPVAVTFLQRLLNALNRQEKDYPDLVADGHFGPRTFTSLKAYLDQRGRHGEEVLLKYLNCLQGARYVELAEGRKKNEDFLNGWAERVTL